MNEYNATARVPLQPRARRVAVIGGGVCGLVAAKALLEEGATPCVLEREPALGGVWRYTPTVPAHEKHGVRVDRQVCCAAPDGFIASSDSICRLVRVAACSFLSLCLSLFTAAI